MSNDIWKYVVTGVVSAGIGGGITYLVTHKRITAKADARADHEIAQVKERYALLRKEGKYADPATAIRAYEMREEELKEAVSYAKTAAVYQAESDVERAEEKVIQAVENLAHKEEIEEEVEEAIEDDETVQDIHNIFDSQVPEFTVEVDPDVDRSKPYIIPELVFMDDEESPRYSKTTVTYWLHDKTLCDERENMIQDIDGLVGALNIQMLGEGPNQQQVIYVRNERLRADYEVVAENDSYSKVVLNLDEDLPTGPKIRKFRGYDE